MTVPAMTDAAAESGVSYPDDFLDRLEIVWGRGFLSPGGPEEVGRIVHGLDLAGKSVLDIGCGTGGPALVLAQKHGAGPITAVDVEDGVLARARANAAAAGGAAADIDFRRVEPGPLPFPDRSFDVVFSKDSMVHIADKPALFAEVRRVLRPGGVYAASDWLGGPVTAQSPEWARFAQLAHLDLNMVTAEQCEAWMQAAGLERVSARDRNAWYAEIAEQELMRIEGPLRPTLLAVVDEAVYAHWCQVRRALRDAVAAGALRPTHLRGYRP